MRNMLVFVLAFVVLCVAQATYPPRDQFHYPRPYGYGPPRFYPKQYPNYYPNYYPYQLPHRYPPYPRDVKVIVNTDQQMVNNNRPGRFGQGEPSSKGFSAADVYILSHPKRKSKTIVSKN